MPDVPSRLPQRGLTAMSNAHISADELFAQQRERLQLRWFGGQAGGDRVLEAVETVARRPSLAGYLNAIYPNKVQILGSEGLYPEHLEIDCRDKDGREIPLPA